MRLEDTVRNFRSLWRTDAMIAEMHLRVFVARIGYFAMATAVAVISLVLFNVAGFLALSEIWGMIRTALALGAFNLVLAGGLIFVAARQKPGRELRIALDLHNTAMDALLADARALQEEAQGLKGALRHPFNPAVIGLAARLVPLLIRLLRKSGSSTPKPSDSEAEAAQR